MKMIEGSYSIEDSYECYDENIQTLGIFMCIEKNLTPIERQIVIRHIVRGETLMSIKDELNLGNCDPYKYYNKAILKLKRALEEDYYELYS